MAKVMNEWDGMKVHGWQKFLLRLLLILTFPFRRWWITLGVLATVILVLIIIPSMDGVAREDIIDWYKEKLSVSRLNDIKSDSIDAINSKIGEFRKNVHDIVPEIAVSQNISDKKVEKDAQEVQFVAWNVAEFKKSKYEPNKKIKHTEDKKIETPSETKSKKLPVFKKFEQKKSVISAPEDTEKAPETKTETVKNDDNVVLQVAKKRTEPDVKDYYLTDEKLNLIYLDEPEKYVGTANVAGPNSLFVDNKFVFLYGIYSDYIKYDVNVIQRYLQDMVDKQTVECYVVAYGSYNNAATALCFVNGVNINREMVLEGMADNVALRIE